MSLASNRRLRIESRKYNVECRGETIEDRRQRAEDKGSVEDRRYKLFGRR